MNTTKPSLEFIDASDLTVTKRVTTGYVSYYFHHPLTKQLVIAIQWHTAVARQGDLLVKYQPFTVAHVHGCTHVHLPEPPSSVANHTSETHPNWQLFTFWKSGQTTYWVQVLTKLRVPIIEECQICGESFSNSEMPEHLEACRLEAQAEIDLLRIESIMEQRERHRLAD